MYGMKGLVWVNVPHIKVNLSTLKSLINNWVTENLSFSYKSYGLLYPTPLLTHTLIIIVIIIIIIIIFCHQIKK